MTRRLALVVALTALVTARPAHALPPDEGGATSSWATSRSLQDHFGIEVARQLLHAEDGDPDEMLRGVDRAVAVGGPDGVALLVKLLAEPRGPARANARILLAVTRALAPFASQRAVARVLSEAVLSATNAPPVRPDDAHPAAVDADRQARLELARETAALALARSGDPHAAELLLVAARGERTGQAAARRALLAFPPVGPSAPAALSESALTVVGLLGDLRVASALDVPLHSLEAPLRAAALRTAGALGDLRALSEAETGARDGDPALRTAATVALLDLGAGDAAPAVRRLIEDDSTAAEGITLSERVAADEIVGALAARVRVSANPVLRASAIAALGVQVSPSALVALRELMKDPVLRGDAAEAIARSDQSGAWAVIGDALEHPSTRRMGARMAALRGKVRAGAPGSVRTALRTLARAQDAVDRAAAIGALVLLGEDVLAQGLADVDPRVRRAGAMACEPADSSCARPLLQRLLRETDPTTRLVLARGLARSGESGVVTTTFLLERLREGGVDAPVAVLALAEQAEDAERDAVLAALTATDALVRAHAARGLGSSAQPWAAPRLAEAYEAEVDAGVRHAIVAALANRTADAAVPSRARALDRAARLDPDSAIRTIAERALRDLPPPRFGGRRDAVWVRAMDSGGQPSAARTATLVRADGLALPVAFDDDGYLVTPAPRGAARLLLAPQLRPYEPSGHGD